MEPAGSLQHSQQPATCPCHDPDKSSTCLRIPFLKIHFNIILWSTPGSSRWSISLSCFHCNEKNNLKRISRNNIVPFYLHRCADKSLARPGRKQAYVSVRMVWISFGALPCTKKKNLMIAYVSMMLKSRPSLTFFRACFLPGRVKDLSAPRYLCLRHIGY